MLNLTEYCLPDSKLLNENSNRFLVWIPDKKYIVLGASNTIEDSLFLDNVIQDDVSVMKRFSGGQTVLLTPNNLIISCVFDHKNKLQPKDIFHNINMIIKSALEKSGANFLSLTGISDIAIAGKKILGSAIYKNKEKLIYHAVLNVGEPATSIGKYLKHPVKEPDYRAGRNHIDFVTSLRENGFSKTTFELAKIMEQSLALQCKM